VELLQKRCLRKTIRIVTKPNIYLVKIAASLGDERDAAKTFGKAWLAGHAGTIAGAAVGAAALGSGPGRRLVAKAMQSRTYAKAKKVADGVSTSRVGKTVGKFFGHKGGPAAAGAAVGAVVGGDIGDYGAIRHGVIQSRRNAKQKGN
jgi:hypothetical protein